MRQKPSHCKIKVILELSRFKGEEVGKSFNYDGYPHVSQLGRSELCLELKEMYSNE